MLARERRRDETKREKRRTLESREKRRREERERQRDRDMGGKQGLQVLEGFRPEQDVVVSIVQIWML